MSAGNMGPGLVQSLEFLKKSSNLPSNFPDMEINRDKVWSFLCFSKVSIDHLFVNPESGKI